MPKIVTRQTRIIETRNAASDLRSALAAAHASETDPDNTDAERAELWAEVAEASGQIQRRSRQLAGLGRGG
jgi:hypothetical protein